MGFTPDDRAEAKLAIYANIVDSILALLDAQEKLSIPLGSNKLEEDKNAASGLFAIFIII